jgi:[ribosomal protein S5]-alanine N-acetyltransferase
VTLRDLRIYETERMVCEALSPEHASELKPLLADPGWAARLSTDGLPPAPGGTPEQLQLKVDHWDRFGFGMWLLRDRSTGATVGRGGLQHTEVEGVDEVEIAWAIAPERWRQGLATELALACIAIAFDDLDLPHVIAYTTPQNAASRGVMTKVGMDYGRAFEKVFDGVALSCVLYCRRRC